MNFNYETKPIFNLFFPEARQEILAAQIESESCRYANQPAGRGSASQLRSIFS